MGKTIKKILCSLLVAVMCLTSVPIAGFVGIDLTAFDFGVEAGALAESGECGNDVYWNYNSETGDLVISGTGPMRDYVIKHSPFFDKFYQNLFKNVIITEGVTSIGNYVFDHCKDMISITIPDSVTTIGNGAFNSSTGLKNITIPDSVTTIGNDAFSGCEKLKSVTLSKNLTAINDGAFEYCRSLNSIEIPDGVTYIGLLAFWDCNSLKNILIPRSVISIQERAFFDCDSLTSIDVDEENSAYSSDDEGILFNKDKTTLIYYPNGKTASSYTIPEGVTTLSTYAFSRSHNLINVVVENDVTTIGNSAFFDCSGLTSITIPDSVTTIGNYAFRDCDSLTDVYYGGTEEQWNDISFGKNNDDLLNATIHFHTHSYTNEITTPATHTSEGVRTYICECKDTYTESIPKLTEHTYTSSVTTEPTHLKEGVRTYICECKDTYTESIPKLIKHTHIPSVTAPTCTDEGYTTYTCECGDSYVDNYVSSYGHKDDNGDYKCDFNCGYEYEKPAEPTPDEPEDDFFIKIFDLIAALIDLIVSIFNK